MARISVEAQLAKLRKAKDALEKKEKELLGRTQDKVIAKILQLMKDSGIRASQIADAAKQEGKSSVDVPRRARKKTVRSKVAPKYRNPVNPEQTWTGRGRTPLWVAELQKAGTLESAVIKNAVEPMAS